MIKNLLKDDIKDKYLNLLIMEINENDKIRALSSGKIFISMHDVK